MEQKENINNRALKEHKEQILQNLKCLQQELVDDLDNIYKGYIIGNKYLTIENFRGADVLPKPQATKFLLEMNRSIMDMIQTAKNLVVNVNTNSIDELDRLEQGFYDNWKKMWTALKNGDVI